MRERRGPPLAGCCAAGSRPQRKSSCLRLHGGHAKLRTIYLGPDPGQTHRAWLFACSLCPARDHPAIIHVPPQPYHTTPTVLERLGSHFAVSLRSIAAKGTCRTPTARAGEGIPRGGGRSRSKGWKEHSYYTPALGTLLAPRRSFSPFGRLWRTKPLVAEHAG